MDGLSEALRLLRVFHDMSQGDAARNLGISAPYLSQIESGKKTPTVGAVARYSEVFEVPASSILVLAERLKCDEFSCVGLESLVSGKILRILQWLEEKKASQRPHNGAASPKKGVRRELGSSRGAGQHRKAS
jgi:transcriptional regulator with XRE-family HTH domain